MYTILIEVKALEDYLAHIASNDKIENDTAIMFRGVIPKLVKVGQLPYHVFAFKLVKANLYEAFCSGSIIGADKVLSSGNCFVTTRKRFKVNIDQVQVVAGIITIHATMPDAHEAQQWRKISKIYSQRFFRFPAYDLAIVKLQNSFVFTKWVNMIPYATLNQNFDGICVESTLKPRSSWASSIVLSLNTVQMLTLSQCERTFLSSCRLYYATAFKTNKVYSQSEGGGLVCYETNDPAEKGDGVLVGVTSVLNVGFPTLHSKVGLFNKWITNSGYMTVNKFTVLLFFAIVNYCKYLRVSFNI